ncbi:FIST C-terminal domain-containing protein [Steroidobacter flavus]|uniref:FIST C-terminal domain-containing protein n=1 Tax=Steroidobacter flavus TaxID=1842136 RepID=A0ABV8SNF1_9GAMM
MALVFSSTAAILISCMGRKLVLRQRVEEEVEAVRDIIGLRTHLAGFYSYGEIAPFTPAPDQGTTFTIRLPVDGNTAQTKTP